MQFINGGAHIQSNPILQDLIPARFIIQVSALSTWALTLLGESVVCLGGDKTVWICAPLVASGKLNSHSFHLLTISQKIIMLDDLMPEKCLTCVCVCVFSADECDEHPAGSICQVFSLRLLL